MKLHDIKGILRKYPDTLPRFVLPDGSYIPSHSHVTEVGYSIRNYIDCGGLTGKEEAAVLQTHVGSDTEHRLKSERFAKILELSQNVLPNDRLETEIEYDCCVTSQYPIDDVRRSGEHLDIILSKKKTQCRVRERRKQAAHSECCGASTCC